MDFRILFIGLFMVIEISLVHGRDVNEIDILRRSLIKIAKEPQINSWKKDEACYDLVHTYKNFDDSMNQLIEPSNHQFNLDILNSLWLWTITKAELDRVNGIYQNFLILQDDLLNKQQPLNTRQWTNFVNTILSDGNNSIPSALKRISDFIDHEKLFSSAHQEIASQLCNAHQSPQQLLYNLYRTISLSEIKGYALVQFSYSFLKLYNIGNNTEEAVGLDQLLNRKISEALRAVKTTLSSADRDVWQCDPRKHEEELTFVQLKQVFQGYVVNEVDLNSQSTCRENCGFYSYSKVYGCFKDKFCSNQRTCSGKVLNCQYIDSDMWICPAENGNQRRYEYIEYEDGQVFGEAKSCSKGLTKVDSWWRWLFWHCSYCLCYCDDHTASSDRYFNLRDVVSDINQNKVVTGVKFQKVNQVIHIQIKQSVLLPLGNVDEGTSQWKPINNYSIFDSDIQSGKDYHTVTWEDRAIDLDDLDSPDGYLLTGLRFRLVGSHLNLEIFVTAFNYTTGKLKTDRSHWHSNDNTEVGDVTGDGNGSDLAVKRSQLRLEAPHIPTKSKMSSVPDSMSNQYMYFEPTDLKKDAAQTTVPFIDIQPVEPVPAIPISGAGIYHKGRDGYGGFLGLKLITMNVEPLLLNDVSLLKSEAEMNNEINSPLT